jgi:hypothetical protein
MFVFPFGVALFDPFDQQGLYDSARGLFARAVKFLSLLVDKRQRFDQTVNRTVSLDHRSTLSLGLRGQRAWRGFGGHAFLRTLWPLEDSQR